MKKAKVNVDLLFIQSELFVTFLLFFAYYYSVGDDDMNWLFAIGFLVLAFYLNFKAENKFFEERKRREGLLLSFGSVIAFILALVSLL